MFFLRKKSHFTPTLTESISEERITSLEEYFHPNNVHDNNEINNVYENGMENIRSLNNVDQSIDNTKNIKPVKSVNFEAKLSKSMSDPETLIKEDRMLIRVERLNNHETLRSYGSLRDDDDRKKFTHSLGWREYIVKLRPGIIELYKSKVW